MRKNITFIKLDSVFKNFIFKSKVLEICGYNPETGEYLVINDGLCYTTEEGDDYGWVVSMYKFKNLNLGMKHFLSPNKHPNDLEAVWVSEKRLLTLI